MYDASDPAQVRAAEPLDKTFERMTPADVRVWLRYVMTGAVVIVVLVFGAYWRQFGGGALSKKSSDWAEFGEYVGGTAGPVLALLTVVGLVLTLVMQMRQLEDSREQLKASQADLERSRGLQLAMAQAMSQQAHYATVSARVAALGAALSVASEQLAQAQQVTVPGTDNVGRYTEMLRRKESLARDIIELTNSLSEPSATATAPRYL